MNDFDTYQRTAARYAVYPDQGQNIIYPLLGLAGEVGEISEKIKKLMRDDNGILDNDARISLAMELGDVLWYLSQMASEIGVPLSSIARLNVLKIRSRALRGRVHGSGDRR